MAKQKTFIGKIKRGSKWFSGTKISGNNTTGVAFDTGISSAFVNDKYLNTDTGDIYTCLTDGDADTATWGYIGTLSANATSKVFNGSIGEWEDGTVDDAFNMPTLWKSKMVYGNGRFLCVGDTVVHYSLDGVTWHAADKIDSSYYMVAATFGDGYFFIADIYGHVYKSSDGVNWTACGSTGGAGNAYGMAYGEGMLVILDTKTTGTVASTMYYSTDNGDTWTKGGVINSAMFNVNYGSGKFIAVGNGGGYYSTDGINWVMCTGISGMLYDVVCKDDIFVAAGDAGAIYRSLDAINWIKCQVTTDGTSVNYRTVCYGAGMFLAAGAYNNVSSVHVSSDGYKWEEMEGFSVFTNFIAMAYGSGLFSLNGITSDGKAMKYLNLPKTTTKIEESIMDLMGSMSLLRGYSIDIYDGHFDWPWLDGVSTSPSKIATTGHSDIAYGKGVFVAACGLDLRYSLDGVTWNKTIRSMGVPTFAVSYGNGIFLTVPGSSAVYFSEDGINWGAKTKITDIKTCNVTAITYGNGKFIFANYPSASQNVTDIYYSTDDGATWTKGKTFTNYKVGAMIYGSGKFIAVGNGGGYYSTDGINWTKCIGLSGELKDVTYGDGVYIAVGASSSVFRSFDGINWIKCVGDIGSGVLSFSAVCYAAGKFVMCGYATNNSGSWCYVSDDGYTWRLWTNQTDAKSFNALCYGEDHHRLVMGVVDSSGAQGFRYINATIKNSDIISSINLLTCQVELLRQQLNNLAVARIGYRDISNITSTKSITDSLEIIYGILQENDLVPTETT